MAMDDLQRFIDAELTAIRDDHTSGAAALGERTARIIQPLWDAAEAQTITLDAFREALLAMARRLATVRAGMAPMAHLASRVAAAVQSTDRAAWLPEVDSARRAFMAANGSGAWLAKEFVARLQAGERAVTLSRSATVTRALSEAVQHPLATGEPRVSGISILESRPGGEGVTLARELAPLAAKHGATISLLPDAALMTALADATCCVLGADALLGDGDAVNKVGSHGLALAARECGIPCYVLADTTKIAPEGWPWQPEAADPTLIVPEGIADVIISSPVFERVPLGLLTVITEAGQLDAAAIGQLAQTLAAGYRLIA